MAKRQLVIEIVGDASKLGGGFRKARAEVDGFNRSVSVGFGTLAKIGAVIGGLSALSGAVRASTSEFLEQQKVAAQTQAVLTSTGSAARLTAEQVDELATAVSNYSGMDDEAVKAGENMLLTFTKIQNRVGAGNDIFTQATKVTADLAQAMGIDMTKAALQVGKALNDPERGFTRLQRIGVAFTKAQVAAIKGFSQLGQTANAQKVIIAELTKEFGGSARAFGESIPGQLARLRESLKNVGGSIVGVFAKPFAAALEQVDRFVAKLSEARGVKAKFNVAVDGLGNIGRDLAALVSEQLRSVDFAAVVDDVSQRLESSLRSIGNVLGRVDFNQVGQRVGQSLAAGLRSAAAFLAAVDWETVGQKIVDGLRAFLSGVDWKAVAAGTIRLLVAAFRAQVELLKGVGGAIARAVVDGVISGLNAFGGVAETAGIKLALKIVEPFTHLPSVLGKPFRAVKERFEEQLAGMEQAAKKSSAAIAGSLGAVAKASGTVDRAASTEPQRTRFPQSVATTLTATGITSAQRNSFFDARISRSLDRVQDVGNIRGQVSALQKIAASIQARIDATKDITRKLNLEDKLVSVRRSIGAARQQIADQFVAALQFNVDRADGDLLKQQAALGRLRAALVARIKTEQGNLDLQRQLFDVQQKQADVARQIRDARQFRSLGLSASGDELAPGLKSLKSEAARISDAIKGTFLDTGKTRSVLQNIRKLLAGGLGSVSADVRSKVKEILDGVDSQLKNRDGAPLTKTKALDTSKIVAGLGLTAELANEIRSRLSGFNTAGLSLAAAPGTVGALGQQVARPMQMTVQAPDVYLDGKKVSTNSRRHNTIHARRNPKQKRGRRN